RLSQSPPVIDSRAVMLRSSRRSVWVGTFSSVNKICLVSPGLVWSRLVSYGPAYIASGTILRGVLACDHPLDSLVEPGRPLGSPQSHAAVYPSSS
ncbi:unnamed protein product, partial [Mycena citricolor]